MEYNLKKVYYLDGIIEEENVMTSESIVRLSNWIEKDKNNLQYNLESAIKRNEKPSSTYIPPKLRRENCYIRYEIYPLFI